MRQSNAIRAVDDRPTDRPATISNHILCRCCMRISFNSNPTTTSSQANSQFCGRKTSARRTARQTKQQTGARVIQIKYFRLCGAAALNETAGAVATSTSDCCRLTGNTIAAEKSPAASSTEGIANQGHTRGRYRKTSETCTVFQLIGIAAGFAHCSRRATDRVVSARACAHTHTRVFGESAYIATQHHRLTQLERDTSNEKPHTIRSRSLRTQTQTYPRSRTRTHTRIRLYALAYARLHTIILLFFSAGRVAARAAALASHTSLS